MSLTSSSLNSPPLSLSCLRGAMCTHRVMNKVFDYFKRFLWLQDSACTKLVNNVGIPLMVKVHTVPQTQSHCIQMLVLLVRVFLCLWHINIHEQFSAGLCGILHCCPKLFKVTCNRDSRLNLTGKSRIKLLCDVFSTRFNFNDSVFWAEGVLLAVVLGTGARWGGSLDSGETLSRLLNPQLCLYLIIFSKFRFLWLPTLRPPTLHEGGGRGTQPNRTLLRRTQRQRDGGWTGFCCVPEVITGMSSSVLPDCVWTSEEVFLFLMMRWWQSDYPIWSWSILKENIQLFEQLWLQMFALCQLTCVVVVSVWTGAEGFYQ